MCSRCGLCAGQEVQQEVLEVQRRGQGHFSMLSTQPQTAPLRESHSKGCHMAALALADGSVGADRLPTPPVRHGPRIRGGITLCPGPASPQPMAVIIGWHSPPSPWQDLYPLTCLFCPSTLVDLRDTSLPDPPPVWRLRFVIVGVCCDSPGC